MVRIASPVGLLDGVESIVECQHIDMSFQVGRSQTSRGAQRRGKQEKNESPTHFGRVMKVGATALWSDLDHVDLPGSAFFLKLVHNELHKH